jgi:hypothetical protein
MSLRDDPSTEIPPFGAPSTVTMLPEAGTVYSRTSQKPFRSSPQFCSAHQSPLELLMARR